MLTAHVRPIVAGTLLAVMLLPLAAASSEPLPEFAAICEKITKGSNDFLGTAQIAVLEAQVEAPGVPPMDRALTQTRLGIEYMRIGHNRRAIEALEAALARIEANNDDPRYSNFVRRRLSLAQLRLGEELLIPAFKVNNILKRCSRKETCVVRDENVRYLARVADRCDVGRDGHVAQLPKHAVCWQRFHRKNVKQRLAGGPCSHDVRKRSFVDGTATPDVDECAALGHGLEHRSINQTFGLHSVRQGRHDDVGPCHGLATT